MPERVPTPKPDALVVVELVGGPRCGERTNPSALPGICFAQGLIYAIQGQRADGVVVATFRGWVE